MNSRLLTTVLASAIALASVPSSRATTAFPALASIDSVAVPFDDGDLSDAGNVTADGPGASSLPHRKFWYPSFDGTEFRCWNDGREDAYMTASPEYYLFADAASCCAAHFQWSLEDCRERSTAGDLRPSSREDPRASDEDEMEDIRWHELYDDAFLLADVEHGRHQVLES